MWGLTLVLNISTLSMGNCLCFTAIQKEVTFTFKNKRVNGLSHLDTTVLLR